MMNNVILIDDEKRIIRSLRSSIDWKAYGFEIIAEASNGIEGLERIKQLSPDLVFTDIRMPGMDGLELIRQTNELNIGTSFVITSGFKDFEYAQQAMRYGVLDYCLKPFEEDELIEALHKFNRSSQKQQAAHYRIPDSDHEDATRSATFNSVLTYINDHFREDISLHNIAEELQLNLSYVSQLFRKNGNETFLIYLTRKRISYACELLAGSNLTIQEISGRVGYTDYFHFAKLFKKMMDQTATQYRDSNKRS
ncbi:DNA-binding response regulator [Paenibacillus agaridevorans]|uniref:DNA-binding response regulator n=1 Tax=Paenibacillus agaridevorans TaxID=171404 RepID=A0A2R5ESS2_9BACL|nr:response regulator [Paenibacillus agaridevorans]GBG06451.1 DNA-binding response regulator [Paenibacillus agaridevorans]